MTPTTIGTTGDTPVTDTVAAPDFGEKLDGIFSDAPAPAEETVETPEEEPPAEPAEEGEAEEQGEEQEASAEEDAEATDEPTEEEELDPTGKKKFLRIDKNRFNNIYRGHKFEQEVAKFAPTVEAARQHYESASDLRHMQADLQSGDPAEVQHFMDYWGQHYPEGFQVLATKMPEYLRQANPQAYEGLREQMVTERIEAAYRDAAESGDETDLHRAQMLEWSITGKYRDKAALPKIDPNAEREAKLSQREQALKSQEEKRLADTWNQIDQSRIAGAKETGLQTEIDKILEPVKARFANAPDLLDALQLKIKSGVESRLGEDFEWKRNHDLDYRDIRRTYEKAFRNNERTDLSPKVQAYVNGYLGRARHHIGSIAKPLVAQATKMLVEENQAVHAKRAESASKKGPTSGGAPPKRSIAPLPKGASLDDQLDAIFR